MGEREGPAGEVAGEALLFVYGTLKRGQSNHARLGGARRLGRAWLEGACLYDLGPFPMAIAAAGRVAGELYAITSAALPELDAFEGCPRLYQRHWLTLADGRQAWVYLGQARSVRHSRQLPEGVWPAAPAHSTLPACSLPLLSLTPGAARSGLPLPTALGLGSLLVLAGALGLGGARAGGFDTLGTCEAWRHSRGLARLELANAIGAAHALTKRHAFMDSTPEKPVALYNPLDIARVCGRP